MKKVLITLSLIVLLASCDGEEPKPKKECPCPWFDGKDMHCRCFVPEDFKG